jgi:aspartyl-tRNA(Asn)/glutamyl-tRNA(Gln) amidotransferase subunit C
MSKFDIEKVERLAGLKLKDDERERIKRDIDEIINYFDILKEVDTDGIDPLVYTKWTRLTLRNDEVHTGLTLEEIKKNRKLFGNNFFRVRRIIGE